MHFAEWGALPRISLAAVSYQVASHEGASRGYFLSVDGSSYPSNQRMKTRFSLRLYLVLGGCCMFGQSSESRRTHPASTFADLKNSMTDVEFSMNVVATAPSGSLNLEKF
jgi:hypothetical protein